MCTPPSLEQHEHVFRLQGDSFICKQMSVFTLMPKMKQYALEARDGCGVCVSVRKGAKDTKETEGGGKKKRKEQDGVVKSWRRNLCIPDKIMDLEKVMPAHDSLRRFSEGVSMRNRRSGRSGLHWCTDLATECLEYGVWSHLTKCVLSNCPWNQLNLYKPFK